MQIKHICYHCYLDDDLADYEYIDERRNGRGEEKKKYLPISKDFVDDGAGSILRRTNYRR